MEQQRVEIRQFSRLQSAFGVGLRFRMNRERRLAGTAYGVTGPHGQLPVYDTPTRDYLRHDFPVTHLDGCSASESSSNSLAARNSL